ncbi:helix-turn-helix domain-containing protein [Streptomyces cellulosae]
MTRSPALPLPPPDERRRLREARALTRAQLAKRLGVRSGTVRAWESGRGTPRGRTRDAYAELLSTPAAETARQTPDEAGEVTSQDTAAPDPTEFILTPPRADTPSEGDPEPEEESGPASERRSSPRRGRPRPSWARRLRPSGRERGSGPVPVARDVGPYLTPAQAFDALYAYCAPALARQAYLLTGRRDLAHESVERAFQRAWDHWPEVARDPDPAGWVRAATHDWALSPWHRFRRRYRQPEPPPPVEDDRALLDALLSLLPPYRRTLVLYDGVGLDLPETAAETEASTRATAGRLMYAREVLAERLPELADPEELHDRLAELASTGRTRAAEPAAVRVGSERRARLWTRTAAAMTVVLIGSTAMTLHTAPTHYEPPVPPGETVRGVPPRVAPGPLSDEQRELRDQLRKSLLDGPERLTPQAR